MSFSKQRRDSEVTLMRAPSPIGPSNSSGIQLSVLVPFKDSDGGEMGGIARYAAHSGVAGNDSSEVGDALELIARFMPF